MTTIGSYRLTQTNRFSLLVSCVVIAGGTYLLYQQLSSNKDRQADAYEDDELEALDVDDEDASKPKVRVLFGSQSGTGEGFAFEMEKELNKLGFNAKAIDLEDYQPDKLREESLVVFVVATYGEGEPTDSGQELFNWLTNEDERRDDDLSGLTFAVYGLGNSQYEFFNQMGKNVDAYCAKWGAQRVFERGAGDDDIGSIEDQFGEWKDGLYKLLCYKYLGEDMTEDAAHDTFESTLRVRVLSETGQSNDACNAKVARSVRLPYDLSNYRGARADGQPIQTRLFLPSRQRPYAERIGICKTVQMTELRQNNKDGSTLQIDFDLARNDEYNAANPTIPYYTADNMGFVTRNQPQMVDKLCARMGYDKQQVISIEPKQAGNEPKWTFPSIVTVENLFTWFVDINGPPGKKLLSTLAHNFTADEAEKASMLAMCDNVQKDVIDKRMTLVALLERMTSVQVDLASMIELLRPLQPRLYTISSSSKVNPDVVSICIKLEYEQERKSTDDEEGGADRFVGVQSGYFLDAKADMGSVFQFYMEGSKFKLPAPENPVIMIGVGAGLAPFAAFVDEGDGAIASKENGVSKSDFGEWWLFFGCRYKVGDYIYQEKLEGSCSNPNGVLDKLKVAFSREQKEKVYVQNLIEQHHEELWPLIDEKKARIYVCGGVAMGRAVRAAFADMFSKHSDTKDGAKYLDGLLKQDIYVQELWG